MTSTTDLSLVLEKLDKNTHIDDSHNQSSIAAFFKKMISNGENLDELGAAAPISLLEPISALEYQSRLNAQMFLKIGGESELDRMKSVLRFLISQCAILHHDSKKPINPLIGEVMTSAYQETGLQAHWSPDAPVHCISEQVSHHPPIAVSRVYSKVNNVSFDDVRNFKFGIGPGGVCFVMKNIGHSSIHISNHNELYEINMADIMIQPRATFIFGGGADLFFTGKLSVHCAQTGLSGEIEFAKKRMFMSQTTDVTGFIRKTESKETVLHIEGDWKAESYFIDKDGKKESMVHVAKCPRHGYELVCKPVAELEPTHTYRVWNSVIQSMKDGDVKSAGKKKHLLENWQRSYIKRIGKEENHVPKYFKRVHQDKWVWAGGELTNLYGPTFS